MKTWKQFVEAKAKLMPMDQQPQDVQNKYATPQHYTPEGDAEKAAAEKYKQQLIASQQRARTPMNYETPKG